MTEKMNNLPTPTLIYPKSSGLYLMSKIQELTANVADLINELVKRDQRIAELEAQLQTPAIPPDVTFVPATPAPNGKAAD
jgi:hypothetical protein